MGTNLGCMVCFGGKGTSVVAAAGLLLAGASVDARPNNFSIPPPRRYAMPLVKLKVVTTDLQCVSSRMVSRELIVSVGCMKLFVPPSDSILLSSFQWFIHEGEVFSLPHLFIPREVRVPANGARTYGTVVVLP